MSEQRDVMMGQLARLTARAISYEPTIATTGVHITREDVLLAKSYIKHRGASLVGDVIYLEAYAYTQDLVREFLMAMVDIATDQKWVKVKSFQPGLMSNMARLSIAEMANPKATQCRTCKGKSLYPMKKTENVYVLGDCPSCLGTGLTSLSDADRARIVGVDEETWLRTWRPKYTEYQKTMTLWDGIFVGGFVRYLSEIKNWKSFL